VEFDLSCDRSGVKFGLSCDKGLKSGSSYNLISIARGMHLCPDSGKDETWGRNPG
jgi:hypothetical protein